MAPTETIFESLYSNIDGELNLDVADRLEAHPDQLRAQHAAWNFCGWVWFGLDGLWHEEVWVYRSLVECRTNGDLLYLINSVNQDYGYK